MARNHSTSGLWLSWKTVPAVTDVWWPHIAHSHNPRGWLHAFSPAHLGQRNPSGQRRAYRYFRQSSSEENRASNSGRLRGKSSTLKYYGWGLPESNGYPDPEAYPTERSLARSSAVASWWHLRQRVRMLERSHSPPPSATGMM